MQNKWIQSSPGHYQLFVIEDPQQTETAGGLILTEKLTAAAEVGFHTGTIYKYGRDTHLLMGFPKEWDMTGQRVVFRQYLSQAVRFKDKIDDKNVFMIRADDIVALVSEGVKVDGI